MKPLILLLFAMATGLHATQQSQVHLAVHTGAEFLDQDQFELSVRNSRGFQVADQFKDGSARLEYGLYTLEIKLMGFVAYERPVVVNQPRTDILARLELGNIANYDGATAPTRILGKIKNSPVPHEELWVRAESIHEGQNLKVADSRVRSGGRFSMAVEPWEKSYQIVVLRMVPDEAHREWILLRPLHGTTVVNVSPHSTSTFEIDLKDR